VEYKIDEIPYHLTTTFLEPATVSAEKTPK
jgi:hypothetical protein